jgi:hypothetical protein
MKPYRQLPTRAPASIIFGTESGRQTPHLRSMAHQVRLTGRESKANDTPKIPAHGPYRRRTSPRLGTPQSQRSSQERRIAAAFPVTNTPQKSFMPCVFPPTAHCAHSTQDVVRSSMPSIRVPRRYMRMLSLRRRPRARHGNTPVADPSPIGASSSPSSVSTSVCPFPEAPKRIALDEPIIAGQQFAFSVNPYGNDRSTLTCGAEASTRNPRYRRVSVITAASHSFLQLSQINN